MPIKYIRENESLNESFEYKQPKVVDEDRFPYDDNLYHCNDRRLDVDIERLRGD